MLGPPLAVSRVIIIVIGRTEALKSPNGKPRGC
jgi:hypothetical protein